MNGGKMVRRGCGAEDKMEQGLYVSEVIGFVIQGSMDKIKNQRFVERFMDLVQLLMEKLRQKYKAMILLDTDKTFYSKTYHSKIHEIKF